MGRRLGRCCESIIKFIRGGAFSKAAMNYLACLSSYSCWVVLAEVPDFSWIGRFFREMSIVMTSSSGHALA